MAANINIFLPKEQNLQNLSLADWQKRLTFATIDNI